MEEKNNTLVLTWKKDDMLKGVWMRAFGCVRLDACILTKLLSFICKQSHTMQEKVPTPRTWDIPPDFYSAYKSDSYMEHKAHEPYDMCQTSRAILAPPALTPRVRLDTLDISAITPRERWMHSPAVTPRARLESPAMTPRARWVHSPAITPRAKLESPAITPRAKLESPAITPRIKEESPTKSSQVKTEFPVIKSRASEASSMPNLAHSSDIPYAKNLRLALTHLNNTRLGRRLAINGPQAPAL